jgi:hypothetical protein
MYGEEYASLNCRHEFTSLYKTKHIFWKRRAQFRNLLKYIHFCDIVKHFLYKMHKEHGFNRKELVQYFLIHNFLETLGFKKFSLVVVRLYDILRLRITDGKLKRLYADKYKCKLIVNAIDTITQYYT